MQCKFLRIPEPEQPLTMFLIRRFITIFLYVLCPNKGNHQAHGGNFVKSQLIFGRPFVKRFALICYRSVVCLSCLSCPVCDVRALWPNGWTDQYETRHAGRPRPWPHCVRWGPSSLSPKRAQPPNFRPISVAAQWLHGSKCHLVWS